MKIAVVTSSFLPQIGGAEFVVHNLANQWAIQGHEVCVINCISDAPMFDDVKYSLKKYNILRGSTRFGYHRFPFSGYAEKVLRRAIDEFDPDFISAHFGYPTGVWLGRMGLSTPYSLTCHGGELTESGWGDRSVKGVERLLVDALNKSSFAVAISTKAKKLMVEMGVDPSNVHFISNGVDLKKFSRISEYKLRNKQSIPDSSLVILSVGREHVAKDYNTGIRAFAKVAAKYENVYYLIVGKGTNKWYDLAKSLGIADRIRFCQGLYGEDLVGAYQQADVFLSCSVSELCPLVVLEAMAAGLPEVVTNVSGSQDMIQTNKNGIVVQLGNVQEMAEALCRLLENQEFRQKLGHENLVRSQHYSWGVIGREYLDCYKTYVACQP